MYICAVMQIKDTYVVGDSAGVGGGGGALYDLDFKSCNVVMFLWPLCAPDIAGIYKCQHLARPG